MSNLRSIRTLALGAALVATLGFVGCENDDELATTGGMNDGGNVAAMGVVNDTCPIMGTPVKSTVGTATHEGHEVGFCCPGCVGKWNAMSEDEKDAFVEAELDGTNMGVIGATKAQSCGGACEDKPAPGTPGTPGSVAPGVTGAPAGACCGGCGDTKH